MTAFPWVVVSQNSSTRYSQIMVPVNNYNYNPKTYLQEDVFMSPYFILESVDYTYEFCSAMKQKLIGDIPSIFNDSSNTQQCNSYFCGGKIPFYLAKGVNSTTNTSHLAVQTYCTQCEATIAENFTISQGLNCSWYNIKKCGYQNDTGRLCMMYYPLTAVSTKTIYYYWSYQTYFIDIDGGLWFLLNYFHYTSRLLYITMSLISIILLISLYMVPEALIFLKRMITKRSLLYIFNSKNVIFCLLFLSSVVMNVGGILSFAFDNTVGLTMTGAFTYTQLGINLFIFTLVIIEWKHISEQISLDQQPYSIQNRILILISFITFLFWGSLLVATYVASQLDPTPGNYIYAAALFGVSIIFGILALLVILTGIVLTKRYLGGSCDFSKIETFQMYKLKFTQVMIITSITLFVFVYIAFYNGLTLWTARDIWSIRFYYLYRSELAFITQFISWCLIFTLVDKRHLVRGYSCKLTQDIE